MKLRSPPEFIHKKHVSRTITFHVIHIWWF